MAKRGNVTREENASVGSLGPAALLVGTIVGAGIFALPATAARAGLLITLVWLAVLASLILLFHWMFAEIVARTKEQHRLPGYVRTYLGLWAERMALVNAFVGGLGVLLIYLVLIEKFFGSFVNIPSEYFISLAWFALVVLIILGIKTIEKTELLMATGIVSLIFILAAFAAPHIRVERLWAPGGWTDALLPFGVLLFSLGGFNAIPEMRDFFIGKDKAFKRAIAVGTLVPAVLYAVFMIALVGAFGTNISDDLSETVALLGGPPLILLLALGASAIITSFLVTGAYLVDTLQYDLGVKRHYAVLVLSAPLFLYLLGVRQFVILAALIGTVFTGSDGILLLLTWRAAKRNNSGKPSELAVKIPRWAFYAVMGLFSLGVIISLFTQFV